MPKCKNCGRQIPKSDKDLCRYCGQRNPFDSLSGETKDITQIIDYDVKINNQYKRKKLMTYSILMMVLGIFSAHLLYVRKIVHAFILFIFNAAFIGGCGWLLSLLNFTNEVYVYWLIAFAILFVMYFCLSFIVMKKGEVVDSDGQQLV